MLPGFRLLVVLLSFLLPASLVAAQQPAAAAGGATVHGTVVDPDGALVPGASITLAPATGRSVTGTSKADGTYTLRGVPPGTYILTVTASGFAPFVKEGVRVSQGANLTDDIKLAIAAEAQQVTVQADTASLSVDPENNASSTTISGDALQALSDDPDELSSELQALAGPSAGPNGGQIYIDGFTGGQLPPKSSILAIRINSNPFSAQYDQLGYGRIEVITKPGTDKFHGNANVQFQDKVFNTSVPFLGAANSQPPYHTLFSFANLTGPLKTGMSFSIGGSYRDIQNNAIVLPTAIYSTDPSSGVMCNPGLGSCTANPYPTVDRAQPNPQTRWDISPRIDMLLGQKNTLTVRFQYESNTQTSNGTGTSLPSLGYTSGSNETTLQLSDTQLWSDRVINETRFEFQRATSNETPFNPGTEVSVQGVISAFGSGGGSVNATTQDHYEVQNYTSIQLTKHFLRLGGRLRTTGEDVSSNANNNGVISYSYLLDPCTDPSVTNKPSNCVTGPNIQPCAPANTSPNSPISSYQCGIPFEFSKTQINNLTIHARQTDFEPYAEDDWKITPNLTWSYGIRLETQNYINSSHDFAPRTSLAFGIPRKNGKTTTVLRAGFGIFYNRFSLGQIEGMIQNDGLNQTPLLFTYPGSACGPQTAQSIAACSAGTGASTSQSQIARPGPGLRSAYIMQSAVSLEQQLGKYTNVSVTYLNARGSHQFMTRVFPSGHGYCGDTTAPGNYVDCTQSEGVFRQNQIMTSINTRTPKGTSIFGFYSANWADSNISNNTITDPYNPAVDYGRASFDIRNRLVLGGTIPLPFLITASPMIFAQSGSPYNLRTGVDNNLDGVVDDRPAFASGVTAANAVCTNAQNFTSPSKAQSLYPGEPYTEVPVNFCTGPAAMSFNMRLNRTFGFGPRTEQPGGNRGGGPGGPPPMGEMGRHEGGRGGGRGGFGGMDRSGSNTGRKYNLSLGVQAFNLFNQVPYGSPVGTLTSNLFGQYRQLVTGPYAQPNAIRRIAFQANFSF